MERKNDYFEIRKDGRAICVCGVVSSWDENFPFCREFAADIHETVKSSSIAILEKISALGDDNLRFRHYGCVPYRYSCMITLLPVGEILCSMDISSVLRPCFSGGAYIQKNFSYIIDSKNGFILNPHRRLLPPISLKESRRLGKPQSLFCMDGNAVVRFSGGEISIPIGVFEEKYIYLLPLILKFTKKPLTKSPECDKI